VNDIAVMFQTEFVRRIRSRPYLLGTIFGLLSFVLIAAVPSFFGQSFGGGGDRRIILAGPPALVAQALPLLRNDVAVVATTSDPPAHPTLAYLSAHGKAAALVELGAGSDGLFVTVYTRDAGTDPGALSSDLGPLNVALVTHLPTAHVAALSIVPVRTESLDAKFANGTNADEAKGIAIAMVTILYVAILLNAQNILASVAEEKTSRIAELLVATISPAKLLAAKILASTATALLQIAVWIGAGYVAAPLLATQFTTQANDASVAPVASSAMSGAVFGVLNTLGPPVIAAFAVFFLLGFLQFAMLYAAAGSLISRTEDLGSVVAPLVIPVIAAFFVAQNAVGAPNTLAAVILSMVPLLSPFVMFARIAVATIPLWQVGLAVIINLGALGIIAVLAGKLYRVGLLTYGRPPKLAQVWAVLRS
jgi:ABC-2 type transport system permease protein